MVLTVIGSGTSCIMWPTSLYQRSFTMNHCISYVSWVCERFFCYFPKSRYPPGDLYVCLDSKVCFFLFIKEVRDSLWLSLPFFRYFLDICIWEIQGQRNMKWLTCHFCLDLSSATKGPSRRETQELSILGKRNTAASRSLLVMLRCLGALHWSLYIQLLS